MREAVGGTWLFQIVIVFILLFSGYLALSVNYSRAFKVKNEIISIIERNEGVRETPAQEEINRYLGNVNHTVVGKCDEYSTALGDSSTMAARTGIYCVEKICEEADREYSLTGIFKAHYKVTVFFKFDLPIFGDLFTFRVKGETNTIYNAPSDETNELACSSRQIY